MKLTELEKSVIGALCFRGELSIAALSKELKQREHKVRYALDRLREQRVLWPHFFINPSALGYTEYQLFVSLTTHSAAARERFIAAVRACAQVSWFGAVGGPFEFDIMLCARSTQEVAAFLDTLSATLKRVDYRKMVALQLAMTYFAPKYLGGRSFPVPALRYGSTQEAPRLDALDRRILAALVNANGMPYSHIARQLSVPTTTLLYRVKTYKQRGILGGVGYFINAFQLGFHPYLFLIELTRSSTLLRKKLHTFCLKHRNVTYLIENLGAWDYQLGARFEDPRHVTIFLDEFRQDFEEVVGNITSMPVFEPLQLEWNPFPAAAAAGGV